MLPLKVKKSDCPTWRGRIRMGIGIVLMPIWIWIGINMEIRIQILTGIKTMLINNTAIKWNLSETLDMNYIFIQMKMPIKEHTFVLLIRAVFQCAVVRFWWCCRHSAVGWARPGQQQQQHQPRGVLPLWGLWWVWAGLPSWGSLAAPPSRQPTAPPAQHR